MNPVRPAGPANPADPARDCPLCAGDGGELLWREPLLRVVRVDERGLPAFLRVILNLHLREMGDLQPADRARVMDVVWAAEAAIREVYAPDKLNLASLGNVVPHVHWHVVGRWADDPWFPDPVWSPKRREAQPAPDDGARRARLVEALRRRLG